ncbi:nuclear transport factor 2 family protein [Streptomyces sp. NPDC086010]|uniref:nuclear transport factor 2 family protein n=1 Tax=Streptomyces sp. NPDC086010 TaxID=3365745 RepID=UPI0037CDF553
MTEMADRAGTTPGAAGLRAAVGAYWAAADARDWEAFAATLSADVVYDLPQTRERVLGRDKYVRFNREYPGDWRVRVERIVADEDGRQAAARTCFTVAGGEIPAVHFFTFDAAGRITEVTDFWPEPYEPPTGREHLVERY